MPQQSSDDPNQGYLMYFSIISTHQKRGYGKILHARGLEDLAKMGVRKYVEEINDDQPEMVKILTANGCINSTIKKSS